MNDLRIRVPGVSSRRAITLRPIVDVALGAVVAVALTIWAVRGPQRAPDVVLENDTAYDLTVTVSDVARQHWTDFALVGAHSQVTVRNPVDEGAQWILNFGAGGDYPIDRAALRDAGWHIRVPAAVGDRLAAAGITAPPSAAPR